MTHQSRLTLLFLVMLLALGRAVAAQPVAIAQGDQAGPARQAPRDGPQLTISKTHSGNFTQGQQGATYTVTVSNIGDSATIGAVMVTDTMPAGLTLLSMTGDGWRCTRNRCRRTDRLQEGSSYPPIVVTVNVAADADSPLVNQVDVKWRGSEATASDSTIVVPPAPVLSITKSHTGNFTQGQQGALYTVTVSNAAQAGPTSGTVTVTETVPQGLTLVSMTGTGWQCASTTCTRNDALASGASYPVITVVVDVATNAVSPQVNVATATGGGSAGASATDPTTVVPAPTWTSDGPAGGEVLAVAIDPLTPTTLYAGTRGGVFKSVDGGGSWRALGPNALIDGLAIDPMTPATLYAYGGGSIFKSVDGGGSWSAVLEIGPVAAFVIDPLTPTTLYAGIPGLFGGGVFKSTDGGASWSAANSGLDRFGPFFPVTALVIDPLTPTTLYVGMREANPAGTFLKSTDGGASWSELNVGFPDRLPPHTVIALAIDPLTPTTLYAATNARGSSSGLYKSLDGGLSWRQISYLGPFFHFLDLAIDPLTPTTVYAMTVEYVPRLQWIVLSSRPHLRRVQEHGRRCELECRQQWPAARPA
jgi:uncharacterized repeat protein (TIGR01451 family)